MQNVARKIDPEPPFLDSGAIVRVAEGGELWVRTPRGSIGARRAVSCLVEPEVGDRVLCAVEPDRAFILAVLERDAAKPTITRLVADGDLELRAPNGRVRVGAGEGIDLVAAKEVTVATGKLQVRAVDAGVLLDRLTFVGGAVRAQIAKARLFAGSLDATLDRLTQRVKRSYRVVEELDQVRAENIDYRAEKHLAIRGENTIMTARELVKVDGEQVHIG